MLTHSSPPARGRLHQSAVLPSDLQDTGQDKTRCGVKHLATNVQLSLLRTQRLKRIGAPPRCSLLHLPNGGQGNQPQVRLRRAGLLFRFRWEWLQGQRSDRDRLLGTTGHQDRGAQHQANKGDSSLSRRFRPSPENDQGSPAAPW